MSTALQTKIEKLDKVYRTKRNKLFWQMVRTWKYCLYQGCNECISNRGLVPPEHDFAGKYGPKELGRV